jgi:hypothetical protein
MNTKLTLLTAAACLSGAVAAPVLNPANGHYYDVIDVRTSWAGASAAASALTHLGIPGHLVTITSEQERDFLIAEFPQITGTLDDGGYALGGYQADTSGAADAGWVWVTGEPWSYTNWSGGEPNDFGGSSEDFLATHDYLAGNPLALWNDGLADGYRGYIVEFSPRDVPEAGATLALLGSAAFGLALIRRR